MKKLARAAVVFAIALPIVATGGAASADIVEQAKCIAASAGATPGGGGTVHLEFTGISDCM